MSRKTNPWEIEGMPWKTESSFLSWLRGGIRRSLWNRNPIKIAFLQKNRFKIPKVHKNGSVTEVWGAKCSKCNEIFPLKEIEVDHLEGNHSLRCKEDIQPFIEAIVFVGLEDLACICRPCHKCKSLSDRLGISFEQAVAEKSAIAMMKSMGALEQKVWLSERDIEPSSTLKGRREQIVQVLMNDYSNGDLNGRGKNPSVG